MGVELEVSGREPRARIRAGGSDGFSTSDGRISGSNAVSQKGGNVNVKRIGLSAMSTVQM